MNETNLNTFLETLIAQAAEQARKRRQSSDTTSGSKDMTIGKRIARLRKHRHMTQQELADRVEVTASCISKYEHGITQPRIDLVLHIAQELNTNLEYLLGSTSGKRNRPASDTDLNQREEEYLLRLYRSLPHDHRLLFLECLTLFCTTVLRDPSAYPEAILYSKEFQQRS